MTREKLTLAGLFGFVATIAISMAFGPQAGLRFVGVLGVVSCVRTLRTGRVGMGVDGYEPSFYLTGRPARVVNVFALLLFGALVAVPEMFLQLGSQR